MDNFGERDQMFIDYVELGNQVVFFDNIKSFDPESNTVPSIPAGAL